MARYAARCLFVISLMVSGGLALADAPLPAPFEVIEHYATLLSEGRFRDVVEVFEADAVLIEHDLVWRTWQGHDLHERLRHLAEAGVRVEVEVAWASGDGSLVVTNERWWGLDTPVDLAPLHAAATYVVHGARLLSVTRVMAVEQRDVLLREAVVGLWVSGPYLVRNVADATFRVALNRADLDAAPLDGGTWAIDAGVLTIVSDDTTSTCRPGDVATWQVRMLVPERYQLVLIDDACPHGRRGRFPGYTRTYVRAEE